jgi:uncharacterized membrane protein YagU involved in acid resistance
MAETRKRWYQSKPVVVTGVSFGLVLAASAGFSLMAVTWPAAPIVAGILFGFFYVWFLYFTVLLRARRRASQVKPAVPTPDAASESN